MRSSTAPLAHCASARRGTRSRRRPPPGGHPPERALRPDGVAVRAVEHTARHVGLDEAGCDGRDGDAVRSERDREGLPERVDPGLGRAVRRRDRLAPEGAPGGDVDDPAAPAAVDHVPGDVIAHVGRAEQVDRHRLPPRRAPGGGVDGGDRVVGEDGRVVHQDVDGAEAVDRRGDHALDGLRLGQVRAHDDVPVAREVRRRRPRHDLAPSRSARPPGRPAARRRGRWRRRCRGRRR